VTALEIEYGLLQKDPVQRRRCLVMMPMAGTPRSSETYAYATLDPKLNHALKLDREAFQEVYRLARGVVTHDGLPFQLPVEMQTAVFGIVLTAWELEMDRPGDFDQLHLEDPACGDSGVQLLPKD
jgi:hypothetical protein